MSKQPVINLKDKKIVLIAIAALAVLIVLTVFFSLKGCQKKKVAITPQATVEKVVQEQKPGSSPQETLSAPVNSGQVAQPAEKEMPAVKESQAAPQSTYIPAVSKKPSKWIKKKKIKDVPVLIAMLKKSLDKGDEKTLNLALKSLSALGEDVVGMLKEEIVSNLSRPDIRRNALWGLFYSDNIDAVPILKTVLKVDPDENVRFVALFVLYSLARDDAGFFEEVSKSDASEKLRLKAQEYYRIKSINQ